jgi:hypothetical protein
MYRKKEIWLLYALVTMSAMVIVAAENPASSTDSSKWIKCTKLNVPAYIPNPHPFIIDAIFRSKV